MVFLLFFHTKIGRERKYVNFLYYRNREENIIGKTEREREREENIIGKTEREREENIIGKTERERERNDGKKVFYFMMPSFLIVCDCD